MDNTKEKLGAEATADELTEEKLGSVSGGANPFVGLPVGQLITDSIHEVEKGQAQERKNHEDFLKSLSIINNK